MSESQEPLQRSAVSDQPEMIPSWISSVCSNQCRGCVNIAGVIQNERCERCFEHVETILLHVITRKDKREWQNWSYEWCQVLIIQGTDHGNITFLHQAIIKVKVQRFGHMGEELMSHVTLLMHYKHSPAANLWWCSAGVWWGGLSCKITSHLLMSFGRISSASARINELWELAFCISWCARMWSWILIHKGIRESRETGKSQPLVHLLIHYRDYLMKFPWGHSFPASVLRSVYLAWGSADQNTGHAVKRVLSTFVLCSSCQKRSPVSYFKIKLFAIL